MIGIGTALFFVVRGVVADGSERSRQRDLTRLLE